jgi:hypothetical protein
MKVPSRVYHASSHQDLARLKPAPSTHGTWVYAVADAALAACFLSGLGGDLTCAVGRERGTGRPYLCERFRGAFEHRYGSKSGSIYILDGKDFLKGQTPWEEEYVCEHAVQPREEIQIDDAAAYLERLRRAGEIALVRYPERVDGIPEDDSDLVERAVIWTHRFGPSALRQFEEYHRALMPRIQEARARAADSAPLGGGRDRGETP